MRFRTDGEFFAEFRAQGVSVEKVREYGFGEGDIRKYLETSPAEPGDTWRIRWYAEDGHGPIAGYSICCPKCKHVHAWTTATNCLPKPCPHEGKGSCWTWSGSAEENTLSAMPSLFASGACGWHGWLRKGVLEGA